MPGTAPEPADAAADGAPTGDAGAADALSPVLTPQGWELLNSLPAYDRRQSLALNQRLREEGHPPERVAAALTQSRLRARARAKFGDFADRMLFTDDGLQQATRLAVAARHADRFRRAGADTLIDLGCGLGGDALAAAALGLRVIAVEADEATAAAATINLSPFPEAEVRRSTAEQFLSTWAAAGRAQGSTGLWLDPARRETRGARTPDGAAHRLSDPEAFSPPLSLVTELAAGAVPVGVKLGPGLSHELVPGDCEAEWVSLDGDVVELALWFGDLARTGVRRAATVLREGVEPALLTSSTDFGEGAEAHPQGIDGLQGVLWEPDGAVIRAGLVTECAELFGGVMLDEHIAYFCTAPDDAPPAQAAGLAQGHRIVETMPFSVKRLRRWASHREIGTLEIKKRGVDVVPERLRAQILGGRRRGGGASATLILTRLGEQRVAVVVEPLGR